MNCPQTRIWQRRLGGGERPLSLAPLISLLAFLLVSSLASFAETPVDYLSQIKPILRERCFACHGALKQEGDLRLDTAASAFKGGASGPAITPDDAAAESLLLERIAATDIYDRMPPASGGEALTSQQIELIRRWILSGAIAPADEQPEADPSEHWAFQPVVRPTVPECDSAWVRNPIDAFIHRQHRQRKLTPQPQASRLVLLRRLYLDLIGIPPTLEDIAACESDSSPLWYEQTVQRLLADPRHGERWARHWMDIWRYSDWWGLGAQLRNSQRHIWHWRDWIIESLNSDTPYDEMVRLMLAADELHPTDNNKLRATGYLARNYFLFNRTQWMDETVEHVSKAFLGLTMNCAKCHDHKFDPLTQVDYYRMRAFFEPYHVRLDMLPGEPDLARDGIPRVFDGLVDTPTYRFIRGDEKNPDTSTPLEPGVPQNLAFVELNIQPVALPEAAWQPERRPGILETYLEVSQARLQAAETAAQQAQRELARARQTAEMKAKPGEQRQEPTEDIDSDGALRQEKEPPAAGVTEAEEQVTVAQSVVEQARAELESMQGRVEAQRAEWEGSEQTRQLNAAAVRAERLAAAATARHAVAVAEQELRQAAVDKKGEAEKKVTAARESLEKAVAAADGEVKPDDSFARFTGAMWTPTRFLDSGKDDPTIDFPSTSSGRRSALAAWITDRRNPLTARVAVNHIWARHFGQPLVPTVFDFGRKAAVPTQSDLLDWLAAELIDSGWSMKHLHALIVSSSTYRMSSSLAGVDDAAETDAANDYWWRRIPTRIESQVVRDALLSLAGTLDSTMGGPPVPGNAQENSSRRSIYFFHSNNERNLFLTTFDEASVKDCYRREQSVVPQQALALTNSRLVLNASEKIANRLSKTAANSSAFTRNAFRTVLGFDPSQQELDASQVALQKWNALPGGTLDNARAKLVWALINHNDFVTIR